MNISNNKRYANEILDDVECYKLVLSGQLKKLPANFWTKPWSIASSREITKYLLEERLHYTREDICKKVTASTFRYNKLEGMLATVFNGSTYKIISNAYPNEFLPWELKMCSRHYWEDTENVKKAVRWLVGTKLGNSRDRVCKEFNNTILKRNGLNTPCTRFGVYGLLDLAYPNEFKPWELKSCPSNYWNDKNNVKQAVRWLVETKLDNKKDRIIKEFNRKFLKDNGFITIVDRYGVYGLLDIAYPGKFHSLDFRSVPNGYWNDKNNVKQALQSVIKKELGTDDKKEVSKNIVKIIYKYGLGGIYSKYNKKKY